MTAKKKGTSKKTVTAKKVDPSKKAPAAKKTRPAKTATRKAAAKVKKADTKKTAPPKAATAKSTAKPKPAAKKTVKAKETSKRTTVKDGKEAVIKALEALVAKGKAQGFLTYDEINKVLPEELLSPDQIDDTLMMFDEYDIEVVDEEKQSLTTKTKAVKAGKTQTEDAGLTDFGSVTDPVKMYLREMGNVTLLSREGEVEIAKKIEAGEQDVLRALLDTTTAVDCILELGGHILSGALRPKHVLRDIDEGDSFVDEAEQTGKFLETINADG